MKLRLGSGVPIPSLPFQDLCAHSAESFSDIFSERYGMSIRSISLRVFFPALLALAAAPLAATSYVMVSDEALVDGAAVAAVVRVVEVDRAVAQRTGGRPATEYRVQVEEALKGETPGGVGGMLAVRVPGGVARNGMALKVYGAP